MSKDRKKLLHIHSSVNDKQPTPATLELGELGVNNAKGNAFISTKNSDGEVVRFSEDDTIVNWMEMKEVFPYEGYVRGSESGTSGVTEADLLNNKSNIIVKLNQVVPKGTDYDPYDKQVNGAKDIYGNQVNPINADGTKDGAGFAIDMSRYAMIDANPSFSSVTTTCHATLSGTTEIKGDEENDCGSKLNIDVKTVDAKACGHISAQTQNFVVEGCDGLSSQATIDMDNVCIVGENVTNVFGGETNIGIDCIGGSVASATTIKGDNISVFANNKLCESGNVVSVFANEKLTIGGKDCDGTLGPNGEIVYYRNPDTSKCGISANTIDGALTEVLDRRKLEITSSITDGNTAYTFTQDSENGDCGLNKTIVIPRPETPLPPCDAKLTLTVNDEPVEYTPCGNDVNVNIPTCNAPLHLQVNGEPVETYYPCEENTFNVEIPTCNAPLTITVNNTEIDKYYPCTEKTIDIPVCNEALIIEYGGNVCNSGITSYTPCQSGTTIKIPSKSSDFYYNGLQILAKKNQKSGQYIRLPLYYPAVPEESGCTSGVTEIKFDTPSLSLVYGTPCGNDSAAYTPFGGLYDRDGVRYSANTETGLKQDAFVVPRTLHNLPHSDLQVVLNRKTTATTDTGEAIYESAHTINYKPAETEVECGDSLHKAEVNFGLLRFASANTTSSGFVENAFFDDFSDSTITLKCLGFKKSNGESLAEYNPYTGAEINVYPLTLNLNNCGGIPPYSSVTYNPLVSGNTLDVNIPNGSVRFWAYSGDSESYVHIGDFNLCERNKDIYIPRAIITPDTPVCNEPLMLTYGDISGKWSDDPSIPESAYTPCYGGSIKLPSCVGHLKRTLLDVEYGDVSSHKEDDGNVDFTYDPGDCVQQRERLYIPSCVSHMNRSRLQIVDELGDEKFYFDPGSEGACTNDDEVLRMYNLDINVISGNSTPYSSLTYNPVVSSSSIDIHSYDLTINVKPCPGEGATTSYTYNPMVSSQTITIPIGNCGGDTPVDTCLHRGIRISHSIPKTYVEVNNPTGIPYIQHWYEKDGQNYVPTKDTVVDTRKTYYKIDTWTTACNHYGKYENKIYEPCECKKIVVDNPTGNPSEQSWFEVDGLEYVPTTDTEVDTGKTYYKEDTNHCEEPFYLYIPTTIEDITNNIISTDNISCGAAGCCNAGCVHINTGLCVDGSVVADSFFSRSDKRLKENISSLGDDDIKKVNEIEFKSFNFKDDESKKKTYGVIAQDVQNAGLDNIVHTSNDGMLNVDYTSLLLLKIASMEKTINDLNEKISLLVNKVKLEK